MNLQSIVLLIVVLGAFVATLRYLLRGGAHKRCSGCGLAGSCKRVKRVKN